VRPEKVSRGEILGAAYLDATGASDYEAMVWDKTHGVRNLNSLIPGGTGWRLREATALNDRGQIVGWGEREGHVRAFRLSPL